MTRGASEADRHVGVFAVLVVVSMGLLAAADAGAVEAIPLQEIGGCGTGCTSKSAGGFQGGAEVLFFKPFAAAGSTPNSILATTGADEFLPAWRLWGGYSNEEGLGGRIRWWQYDQASASSDDDHRSRLIFQKLDGEVTQQACFGSWELLFSGGLTYVGNGIDSLPLDSPFNGRFRFDGVGVTAGLQAIRDIAWLPSLKMFGTMQWSGVYGNSTAIAIDPFPIVDKSVSISSTTGSVLELSIGPRWERRLDGGGILFAGGAAEAQYWTTGLGTLYSVIGVGGGGGDIGLVGLSVNVGLRR